MSSREICILAHFYNHPLRARGYLLPKSAMEESIFTCGEAGAGQGMLNVLLLLLLLLLLLVGGTILAYPCAFKRGVFREVFYLAHVLSKKVCSERCVQRGVFREP